MGAAPKAKADAKKKEKKEDPADQIPRVEQPSREEMEQQMQKVQDVITDMHKKQQALTEKIQQHSGGKDEFYQAQAEVRKDLDIISAKMDALMAKKDELKGAMGSQREEGIAMKNDLQKMKKTVGYASE